jgi:hypothetical protein
MDLNDAADVEGSRFCCLAARLHGNPAAPGNVSTRRFNPPPPHSRQFVSIRGFFAFFARLCGYSSGSA